MPFPPRARFANELDDFLSFHDERVRALPYLHYDPINGRHRGSWNDSRVDFGSCRRLVLMMLMSSWHSSPRVSCLLRSCDCICVPNKFIAECSAHRETTVFPQLPADAGRDRTQRASSNAHSPSGLESELGNPRSLLPVRTTGKFGSPSSRAGISEADRSELSVINFRRPPGKRRRFTHRNGRQGPHPLRTNVLG